jgi:methionyl aminopeptidase
LISSCLDFKKTQQKMSEFQESPTNPSNEGKGSESIDESHLCTTPGCGKPAKMGCPTCLKLGIPPSRFCGQECFKGYWDTHKLLHKTVKRAREIADPSKMPNEFTGFNFTGSLRPYQKTPKRAVPDHILKPDYAIHPQGFPVSEQEDRRSNSTIKVYSPEEIEAIREVSRIGREVLDIAGQAVKVGVTGDELDRIVHEATIEKGGYPSPLNYHRFPKSVCTSINEVICHGIPDLRPLEDGDIVNIDVSVYKNGYHTDLNETFLVGNVDEKSVRLVKCAYEALAAAVAICRPGTLYRDCGDAIAKVTKAAGCSIVTTYCGHGVGNLFHTAPNIPHYPKNKAKGTMAVGHIFTIEPMINLGKSNDVLWPDEWTAVTADGSRSSQFEHTILVTETGCELLTARPGDPTDRMIWLRDAFQR